MKKMRIEENGIYNIKAYSHDLPPSKAYADARRRMYTYISVHRHIHSPNISLHGSDHQKNIEDVFVSETVGAEIQHKVVCNPKET